MLKKYQEKRDFKRTPEPKPGKRKGEGKLIFVVQKHTARRLHFDFRLELDGVLKSWALPVGPSLNPKVKRLAVMVEDHPLDYGTFEGTIPKGEYGAGEVIVWDRGFYTPQNEDRTNVKARAEAENAMRGGLLKGKISFALEGHKLKGSWALVKMRKGESNWLLIKHTDQFTSEKDITADNSSVLSGTSIENLKAGEIYAPDVEITDPGKLQVARSAPFPARLSPMLAVLGSAPFSNPGWFFEPKLDGYRTIAFINNNKVKLISRRGLDITASYPLVLKDLSEIIKGQAVIDGEIVALDEKGQSCFQCLQQYYGGRKSSQKAAAIVYYVFDVLFLGGYSLLNVPIEQRKAILQEIIPDSAYIKKVVYFAGDGAKIYDASVDQGLEGILAKKKDSIYEPGKRSSNWVKIKKTQSDEFVIGGYSKGTGNRARTFGALLLGYYGEDGKLLYAGHVGSGFNDADLTDIKERLETISSEKCPFSEIPPLNAETAWVRPELVVEIKYSQWTMDKRLRTPVFMRLRDDKLPAEASSIETLSTEKFNRNYADDPPNDLDGILDQLSVKSDNLTLEANGHRLSLGNLNKEMWPAHGSLPPLTKRDFLKYLARVSPFLLAYLRDRPLTLIRYPGGIKGKHFYQKHWDSPKPGFVATAMLSEHAGIVREYLLCNNLMTLMWLGQVANVEFHTWLTRVSLADSSGKHKGNTPGEKTDATQYPDFIILDFDPYVYSGKEAPGDEPELNRKGFEKASKIALSLKEILDSLKILAFIKTSGKTGLHIYIPILREFKFDAVRSAAETISRFLLQEHPRDVTIDWQVEKRSGKIFIDYNQNVRGKSLAAPYSPRAVPGSVVSVPLKWSELGKVYPTDFNILNVPERLAAVGDLWHNLDNAKNNLKSLLSIPRN